MIIKLMNINSDKGKKLWIVVLVALTVALFLIVFTMNSIIGKNSNIIKTNKKESIFDALSYQCEYNVSVVSNKNLNNYNFKENYKIKENETEFFEFITENDNKEQICYTIEDNCLKIKSNSQIKEYILSEYVVSKTNLLSISTFISLYNDLKPNITNDNETKHFKIEIEEIENKTIYRIIFFDYETEKFSKYSDILNDKIGIKKMELIVLNDTGKPLQYIVYNKEDKAFLDIEYIFFDINNSF